MQERKETSKHADKNDFFTLNSLANLGFKTTVISFSISAVTQPFQALLTQLQLPSPVSSSFFRSVYRGFVPYALAGQKRGAVAVTSKQTNRELAEEERLEKDLTVRNRWLGTIGFSQADLVVSNALSNKAKLESAEIINKTNFKWSFTNYAKLTGVNWGSRSFAGFINFAAIGFAGDYVSSFYKFDNEFYNKLAGGATSGVIATLFTTIPNSYADRKVLASKVENNRLLTSTAFTMFGQMKSHVKTVGPKEAISTFITRNFLKEVFVRSPQAALTFGIIFGLDHLMGPEPLKNILPAKIEELDSKSDTHSKRM